MRHSLDNALLSLGPELQAHAARVLARVTEHIEGASAPVTLGEFVHYVLYTPGLGYYAAGLRKFGEGGDFVTAPELGDVFARCLAVAFAPVLKEINSATIVELGAGTGQLAYDLLLALDEQGVAPRQYAIVEVSPDLVARQKQQLQSLPEHLANRVIWMTTPPSEDFDGIVFGNEVIDALPFERFRVEATELAEIQMDYVAVKDGKLQLHSDRANQVVASYVHDLKVSLTTDRHDGNAEFLVPPYTSEVRPDMSAWLQSFGAKLRRGVLLFIDYGTDRTEFYHPERDTGTMTCHFRHRVHDDVLHLPGLQDITAWVDFSQLMDDASSLGWQLDGYATQAHFLISCDMDTWLAERITQATTEQQIRLGAQVRTLTMPGEMGERFKVIAFKKNIAGSVFPPSCMSMEGRL